MFRKELQANTGMIFVYRAEEIMRFWMRNTQIPLSIAFVDKNRVILETHDMKPFDQSIISSSAPVRYAIEVKEGWFAKNKILPGSKIRFEKK